MAEKTIIAKLGAQLRTSEKKVKKLRKEEAKVREQWTKRYNKVLDAAIEGMTLKVHGTLKEEKLRQLVLSWKPETKERTKKRNALRSAIKREEGKITNTRIELAGIVARAEAEQKAHDEIVEQSFLLSGKVADAWETRARYLNAHVYTRLVDDEGNLRSQITFVNSEGTRKIIAMVNTITIVAPDLAAEAKRQIELFFARLLPDPEEMDASVQSLFELSRKLLVEKTKFKIGPDLYTFLGLKLNKKLFPELRKAQDLLKMSLGSEKTSSYIRLYEREQRTDPWTQIKIGGR